MYSRQLESFVKTAEAGSFTKAAKDQYIAPSSLIQQIDSLEMRVGIKLFERGRRGVELTEAGRYFYEASIDIMNQCIKAIEKANKIQNGDKAIKVATSLLMKCRLLPSIWSQMIEKFPDTRIDIISLESAGIKPGNYLDGLGFSYDVMEGLYMSKLYDNHCKFLELIQTPLCIAIPKTLLEKIPKVVNREFLKDLDLVLMKSNVSAEYDEVRKYLEECGASKITDVPFYTMQLFTDCELNNRAIVTTEIWEDIHPDLISIPFEKPFSMPYGLIFPKDTDKQTEKLYQVAKKMYSSN